MSHEKIPLIILGGRDRQGSQLPESGRDKQLLGGYKGADLQIAGRPLIQVLMQRLRESGVFGPIYIAGPARIYEPIADGAGIIETDSGIGENMRAVLDFVAREGLEQVGVTTCDILPDRAELALALEDFEQHRDADFWMPQCRIPDDYQELGASDWKPKYWLHPEDQENPVPILPGHLLICTPRIIRSRFVLRFFALLYRTRNRPVAYRRLVLARTLLWSLLVEDIKHVFSLRPPHILVPVVYNALMATHKLKAGRAKTVEIAFHIRRIFIKRAHQLAYPQRRGRVLVIDGLSLAKDIDTVEEAKEVASLVEGSDPYAGV